MFLNPPVEPIRFASASILFAPIGLAIVRTLFSFYIFVAIITKLSYYAAQHENSLDGQDFSYFTSLTYWGLGFYFAFASLHTWSFARTGVPLIQRWPAVLKQLHSILYTTIVVFPFIVTSV